jgi:Uma2 family endonuclease
MAKRDVVLTYEDYAALPADGRRYEVHDGELSVTPAPSPQHQIASRDLFSMLHAHVRQRGLGEVLYAPLDVILSESAIVQPDIVYLDQTRLERISRRGIEGAPTLVVEVLSPSTAAIDRSTKRNLYARHGVPFYWIVDFEGCAIEALALGFNGYTLVTRASGTEPMSLPPFPDLALVPAALWP